jgi:WD40 repeat protein
MKAHVKTILSFCFILALFSIGCAPITLSPQLRIETGMHTAAVTSIDIDRKEHFFVTSSLDKTVRIWALEDGSLLLTRQLNR